MQRADQYFALEAKKLPMMHHSKKITPQVIYKVCITSAKFARLNSVGILLNI